MGLEQRTYAVGLPVIVTIDDTGWVVVDVDLSELESEVRKNTEAGPLGDEWAGIDAQETAVADSEVLEAWVREHSLHNEGHAEADQIVEIRASRIEDGWVIREDSCEPWRTVQVRDDHGDTVLITFVGDDETTFDIDTVIERKTN